LEGAQLILCAPHWLSCNRKNVLVPEDKKGVVLKVIKIEERREIQISGESERFHYARNNIPRAYARDTFIFL